MEPGRPEAETTRNGVTTMTTTKEKVKVQVFSNSHEVYAADVCGARFYPDTYMEGAKAVWLTFTSERQAQFFCHGLSFAGIESSIGGRVVSISLGDATIRDM